MYVVDHDGNQKWQGNKRYNSMEFDDSYFVDLESLLNTDSWLAGCIARMARLPSFSTANCNACTRRTRRRRRLHPTQANPPWTQLTVGAKALRTENICPGWLVVACLLAWYACIHVSGSQWFLNNLSFRMKKAGIAQHVEDPSPRPSDNLLSQTTAVSHMQRINPATFFLFLGGTLTKTLWSGYSRRNCKTGHWHCCLRLAQFHVPRHATSSRHRGRLQVLVKKSSSNLKQSRGLYSRTIHSLRCVAPCFNRPWPIVASAGSA